MKILFLDDNEDRHTVFKRNSIGHSVDHVYDAQQCIAKLSDDNIVYDRIYLDHDLDFQTQGILNPDEEDGRFVCHKLKDMKQHINAEIIVHSLNHSGSISMSRILFCEGFHVYIAPFAWTIPVDELL